MKNKRVSKREIELRDNLDKTLQDNSKAKRKYLEAKYTLIWMKENNYLIPEKLNT